MSLTAKVRPADCRPVQDSQALLTLSNNDFCRYWRPESQPTALAFISHGFSEHLGNYHSVGNALAAKGILAFGHDHSGHGKSEGIQAYIETVDDYVADLIAHCDVS